MSTRKGYRSPTKVDTSKGPIQSLLSLFWDSGVSPLSPNSPHSQIDSLLDTGDRGNARFTPEAEANRRRHEVAYKRQVMNSPEYNDLLSEVMENTMDFSGGIAGTIKRFPERMAKKYSDLNYFKFGDHVGESYRPTEADMTDAGVEYVGQDALKIDPEPFSGGPQFTNLQSSVENNLLWAGDDKMKSRYLSPDVDRMVVMAMGQDAHKSNFSITNAVFKSLQASMDSGRMTKKNIAELDKILRNGGAGKNKYTPKLAQAEKLLAKGMNPKEVANKLGFTRPKEDAEMMMRIQLKNMPNLNDREKLIPFLQNATYATRGKIVDILSKPAMDELNGPNVRKIIRESLDPNFAGVNIGSGLSIAKIDKEGGLINLEKEGLPVHPSYEYGIKGSEQERLPPFTPETLFPDFFNRPDIQAKDKQGQMYTFKTTLPVQEITPELAEKLDNIAPLQNIKSQKQARLVMDFAEGNWATSDLPKTQGGISPTDFSRALMDSDASSTLSLYTSKEIKEGIKDGSFKVYQLGKQADNNQVYFGLKKNYDYKEAYGFEHPELTGNETALVGVVNNEKGASGVGGPAVLLKAIQEGAEVLDAWIVPSKKYPSGFLPELYNDYGFVKLGEVPFDPQYKTKAEIADMEAYWESTGWDRSMGYPSLAIMKWKGDDAIRPTATRDFVEQNRLSPSNEITGLTSSTRKTVGSSLGKNDGSSQRKSLLDNKRGDTRSIRTGDRASIPQRSASLLSELAQLTPEQAEAYGIDYTRTRQLGKLYPSLLQ